MILLVNRRRLISVIVPVLLLVTVAGYRMEKVMTKPVQDDSGFRVYVHGQGTVQGVWAGHLGIAVIGVETRPDTDRGKELKVISLLVSNQNKEKVRFDPDIGLKDPRGEIYLLHGAGQPVVEIAPGAVSQGTVIIDVPRGIKDGDWRLTITGGPLPEPVDLPLKVITVQANKPE